jgi:hypothetical protein
VSDESQEKNWQQGNASGHNKKLLDITMSLAKLHTMTIQKKLAEMKAHVNVECSKLNHPAAREFADEINKLKIE